MRFTCLVASRLPRSAIFMCHWPRSVSSFALVRSKYIHTYIHLRIESFDSVHRLNTQPLRLCDLQQGSAGHVVVRADEATDEAALRYNDLSSSSDEEGCDGGMDSVHSRVCIYFSASETCSAFHPISLSVNEHRAVTCPYIYHCLSFLAPVAAQVESQIHLRDVARSSTPGGAVAVAAAVVTGSSTAPDDDDDDDGTTPLALTRQSDEII